MLASVSTRNARNLPCLVQRQLGFGDVVAAMASETKPSERLATHFTGRFDPLGGPGDHGLLAVVELLDAEAAADIGRNDAQLVLRDVQHEIAHQEAHDMRKLAGGPQRVVIGARHRIRRSPRAAPSDCRSGGC